MQRSDSDIVCVVDDLDTVPHRLQSRVQELADNPDAFERRAAAVEIAFACNNATLLAVADNDLDPIEMLTVRSLDEPTRFSVGDALGWWSCRDEHTRSECLHHQQVVVDQIARRVDRLPVSGNG
ncbi:MAG: hypothetical protein ACLPVY_07365 [Acidimicrobiia bacterium]